MKPVRTKLLHPCVALLIIISGFTPNGTAQEQGSAKTRYKIVENLRYRSPSNTEPYIQERCRLDLYYPESLDQFATVVWFHGGGLKGGNRFVPDPLKERGIAVAAVNYRLHPKVKSPTYVKDAAAATAWVFKNIKEYGGSPDRIFISGHSAGGYCSASDGMTVQA